MASNNEEMDINVNVNVDDSKAVNSLGDLKRAIKDAEDEMIRYRGVNQKAFEDAAMRAGDLKDKFKDVKTATNSLSGEPIENLSKSFGNLGQSIKNLDMQGFKDSLGALKTTIMGNPILLLAGVFAGIGAAMYALKDAGGSVTKAFNAVGESVNELIILVKKLTDSWGLSAFAAEESSKRILAAKQSELSYLEIRYNNEIALAKAAGKEVYDLERKKTQALLDNALAQDKILEDKVRRGIKLTTEEGKLYSENNKLEMQLRNQLKVIDIEEQTAKTQNHEKEKVRHEEKKVIREEELKSLDDILAKEKELADAKQADYDQRELQAQVEQQRQIAERTGSVQAAIDAITMQRNLDLQNLTLTETERVNIINAANDQIIALHQKEADDYKKQQLKKLEVATTTLNNIQRTTSVVTGAISAISEFASVIENNRRKKGEKENKEAAKRQFNVSKGIQLVQAGIAGAMAVLQAYQSGLAYPFIGPATGAVFAAIAGVMSAAQIGAIAAKKFPEGDSEPSVGSSPSIPSSGGAGSSPSPQIQAPTFFGLGQNNLINNPNSPDQRVYVVESDITNSQRKVSTIESRSVLGG